MGYVWLNGELIASEQALISIQDRGFALGDGVFETIKADKGQLELFSEHMARLCHSASVFGLILPVDTASIQQACLQLLNENGLASMTAALRVTLTRGISQRGIDIDETASSSLVITASGYNAPTAPLSVMISSIRRSSFGLCSQHKTLNYLENILAKKEAKAAGFDDALMLNEKNEVVCATTANVFFKRGEELVTPGLSCGALPGVMRQAVIDEYKSKGIAVNETVVGVDELKELSECFITNSLIGKRQVILPLGAFV